MLLRIRSKTDLKEMLKNMRMNSIGLKIYDTEEIVKADEEIKYYIIVKSGDEISLREPVYLDDGIYFGNWWILDYVSADISTVNIGDSLRLRCDESKTVFKTHVIEPKYKGDGISVVIVGEE